VAHERERAMDAYAYLLEQLHEDDGRRLGKYVEDPRAQFTTWLVIVARRLCVDFLRQRYGRHHGVPSSESAEHVVRRRLADLIADQFDDADPIPDPEGGPDSELRRRDLAFTLENCLAGLPPAHRVLLAMRFEDDLPVREIARILRYPTPFHLYRTLNAVLTELRQALRQRGVRDAEP